MRRWTAVAAVVAAGVLVAGCSYGHAPGRERGAKEAAGAITAGTLKLKEYPPLPSPAGHQEYIRLLRERCGVEYEVPQLPPGVSEGDFIQEVRGWNDTMKAEIERRFGAGILGRLQDEGQRRWQEKARPQGKGE
jgi:hypothetical protein